MPAIEEDDPDQLYCDAAVELMDVMIIPQSYTRWQLSQNLKHEFTVDEFEAMREAIHSTQLYELIDKYVKNMWELIKAQPDEGGGE